MSGERYIANDFFDTFWSILGRFFDVTISW